MTPLRRMIGALTRRSRARVDAQRHLEELIERLRTEITALSDEAATLGSHLASAQARLDRVLAAERARLDDAASMAALPSARLRSDRLALTGPAAARLAVQRHTIGRSVELPVARWLGVTECVTTSPEVRALWETLLAAEAACEDVLRGEPSTVLDCPAAGVSRRDVLEIAVGAGHGDRELAAPAPRSDVLAVPRFTYDFPPRKLRNVGHWLLDCVPQAHALLRLAPDATILVPPPWRDAHWSALEAAGVPRTRVMPWTGEPIACGRLLVQESDGRAGRGRPLPMLLDMRQELLAAHPAPAPARRRIFVSRRDAKQKRQWMSNHDAVEALFRSRGFEVLVARETSFEEQVRAFREAEIVAGISGAGLADIVFAPAGTHVIVLLTDSLMEWYAAEQQSRSIWTGGAPAGKLLNELSDSPRFYTHLAAACEQYCHTFVSGDELPIAALSGFVDRVLEQVARG